MWQLKLLLIQAAALSAVCAAWLALSALLPADALAIMYGAFIWVICPVWGGYLTIRGVLRGMQPYLALWALPIWPAVMQKAVTGTALGMGVILAYALVGLVCAAAGDELRKRRRNG